LAQAENLQSIHNKAMETHQQQLLSAIHSITLVFMTFSGDVLMTLEVSRKIIWRSILEMIATEAWYQTCERWKFVFESEKLDPDDILEFIEDRVTITCVKIDPHVVFELPGGEFLVSVSFSCCNIWYKSWGVDICLNDACHCANQKLMEMDKDGYGSYRFKIHPLHNYTETNYVFRDKNGKGLDMFEKLEDPGDENMLIVAVPKEVVYCNDCETSFRGPLRNGEERKYFRETISLCSICGFLHCPSCCMYSGRLVGTYDCYAFHNM
jgi:hypothetical protein